MTDKSKCTQKHNETLALIESTNITHTFFLFSQEVYLDFFDFADPIKKQTKIIHEFEIYDRFDRFITEKWKILVNANKAYLIDSPIQNPFDFAER